MLETKFGSGQSVKRVEDDRLLRGEGVFVDDIKAAGTKRLVFVRSPYAHADVTGCDTTAAQGMPGCPNGARQQSPGPATQERSPGWAKKNFQAL